MLATQVQYWAQQENKRHNMAQDVLGFRTLEESQRHNIVSENENIRHNVAQEDYWSNSLSETFRHNVAQEGIQTESNSIGWANANINLANAETNRLNAETNRANAETSRFAALTNYEINTRNADTNWYNAQTSRIQSDTARYVAQANYNLGLDANRIAQQNADTSSRNADINWLNYTNSLRGLENRKRDTDINATNALTNVGKLKVAQDELDLQERNLTLQQQKFHWQIATDAVEMIQRGMESTAKIFTNVLRFGALGNGG